MDYENLYDSDIEDFFFSGKKIEVVYFNNVEQFMQNERELNKNGFKFDSNTAQYIIIKPRKDDKCI